MPTKTKAPKTVVISPADAETAAAAATKVAPQMTMDHATYATWAAQYHQECMRDRRSIQLREFYQLMTFDVLLVTAWFTLEEVKQTDTVRWMLTSLVVAFFGLYFGLMLIAEHQNSFDRDHRYVPLGRCLWQHYHTGLPGLEYPEKQHKRLNWFFRRWAGLWYMIAAGISTATVVVFLWAV